MIKFLKQIENNRTIHLFVITILPIILYAKTFSYGFNLDDDYILKLVSENKDGIIGVFKQFYNISDYRPITVLSFYIEKKILGEINPKISHFMNVMYYILLNISIYQLIKNLPIENARVVSFICCIFFIIHPSHAEVVCSIKNRDNLLSMIFMCLSLIQIFQYYFEKKIKYLILSLILYGIAILSKRDAYSYIFIVISYYLIFVVLKNHKKQLFPILITMLGVLLVKIITDSFSPKYEGEKSILVQHLLFTENPLSKYNSLESRSVMSLKTYWYYIKMMILPDENKFYYGYNTITLENIFNLNVILLVLLYSIITYLIVKNYKRYNLKFLTFGTLWFITSLIYCNNFIFPISGIVANRYGFIASLGFIIIMVTLINIITRNLEIQCSKKDININRKLINFILILFSLILFSIYTVIRVGQWRDIFTLIKADTHKLYNSFEGNRIALNNVLYIAINNKDLSNLDRKEMIQSSIIFGLNAKNIYAKNNDLNEKLAGAYKLNKQYELSKAELNQIIQNDKQRYSSYELLGDIYFENESKFDSASLCYKKVINLNPNYETAYFKYLNSKYKEGKKSEIYTYFDSIATTNPNNYLAMQCIGYYYLFELDTLRGMQYIKASFDKGYKDIETAKYVQSYLLKYKDTISAKQMFKYINEVD